MPRSRHRSMLWVVAFVVIGATAVASLSAGPPCPPGTSCCGSLSCGVIFFNSICTESGGECGWLSNCCVPSEQYRCCRPNDGPER
jgi:hypothetical protein